MLGACSTGYAPSSPTPRVPSHGWRSMCGDAQVNILALQIYPELGAVTDDLVVETPDAWTPAAVVELVSGAGGDEVSVVPCATHDLVDQPTAWLRAAMTVMDDPGILPSALTGLLGPRVSWSATEQVRAEVLAEIADRARSVLPKTSHRPRQRRPPRWSSTT